MEFSVEAILFDIDGTLVDSTAVVERVWRTWAVSRGLDGEEILSVSHGRRTEDTVALFLPEAERVGGTAEVAELELADLDDVLALPAAATLLQSLPPERWAAVTSGTHRVMRARLAGAGLPVPEVLIAAEDVRAGKPDPEGYRRAAELLGVAIDRCLVIEDAPAGLEAGHAAGARTLAVATSHDPSALTAADAVVPDLTHVSARVTPAGLTVTTR
ncbi:HAD-IA family hydrolase [Frondihabitans cladoniiphilus]|uniref:HAD family hydrolase n=1 Tax=Frondihabitans cladoniiphilus TaxID=715785 RepID=A0ABP8VJ84_9MICO